MGLLDSRLHRKLHERSGETLRWFKAVPVPAGAAGARPDGVKLVEQTLPPEARFLVGNTEENQENTPFGFIAKGTVQLSAFPDWARFHHLDRIILTAPGRVQSAMQKVRRAANGDFDRLMHTPVKRIANVWLGGVVVEPTEYEVTETGLRWVNFEVEGSAPPAGAEYAVEYEYYPRFICLPQKHRTSPTDRNGISFPLHYWLTAELRSSGDEI